MLVKEMVPIQKYSFWSIINFKENNYSSVIETLWA